MSEPPEGHFDRFREKLGLDESLERYTLNRNFILKIAAVIVLLLATVALVFDFTAGKLQASQKSASIPQEIQDAMKYYDQASAEQLGEIRKLACCGQDYNSLNSIAEGELKALNAKSEELKKVLTDNPGDERVQSALIQNEQMKKSVMDNMVEKIKIAKKEK
ncbi:MAG: hypothetical protein Q8867_01205 [Bacteroidota bacterium]|nr:hypothetical protein [Bacteroidota bacterium]